MTKDTPKWPEEKNEETRWLDMNVQNAEWNKARAACIAAFEEWRKGRELIPIDKDIIRQAWIRFFDCLGVDYRNNYNLENAINQSTDYIHTRYGVRRELDELDEEKLKEIMLDASHGLIHESDAMHAAKAICQRFGVRKVPTVEEINLLIRKEMNCDFVGDEYTRSNMKTVDLAKAIHKLITGGDHD